MASRGGSEESVEQSRSPIDRCVCANCRRPGAPAQHGWLLLTEALLLALAALSAAFDLDRIAVAAIVLAMGLENAVFQLDGGAGFGLTYVAGALVKVGQLLAAALTGGARFGWLPNLVLWAALVLGSLCGALVYHRIKLAVIWFGAAAALALGALSAAHARGRH